MAGNLTFRHKGQEAIDPTLAAALSAVGKQYGLDLGVLSGYRSPAYNAAVGGAKKSYHMHGKAADLDMSGWSDDMRANIVRALASQGVGGFITYDKQPNMLHVDLRDNGGKPLFMHNKSARYMDAAPEWFRNIAAGQTAVAGTGAPPVYTDTGKFDLLGEVMNAAPQQTAEIRPQTGGMTTQYNGRVFNMTPRAITGQGPAAPVPPPAPMPQIAGLPAMPEQSAGGSLGGILSGLASAISAGQQAQAQAQAQADAEWQANYEQSLGPAPVAIADQMQTDIPRLPTSPLLPTVARQQTPTPTKEDILAQLFGGAARPANSITG